MQPIIIIIINLYRSFHKGNKNLLNISVLTHQGDAS